MSQRQPECGQRVTSVGHGGNGESLFPLVYEELHALAERFMRGERAEHTLQPTAVVNEVYLRLAGARSVEWSGRDEFFAIAATTIRRILVEHARKRNAAKRGGDARRVSLTTDPACDDPNGIDLLALDEGLSRLAELSERQSRVVELRFFGGLGVEETARVLGVSPRTVKSEWRLARAWLRAHLER